MFDFQRSLSLVDVDGLNHLKSSQVTISSRVEFRDDIVERDGTWVVTGVRAAKLVINSVSYQIKTVMLPNLVID